jgi:hypothetical protein
MLGEGQCAVGAAGQLWEGRVGRPSRSEPHSKAGCPFARASICSLLSQEDDDDEADPADSEEETEHEADLDNENDEDPEEAGHREMGDGEGVGEAPNRSPRTGYAGVFALAGPDGAPVLAAVRASSHAPAPAAGAADGPAPAGGGAADAERRAEGASLPGGGGGKTAGAAGEGLGGGNRGNGGEAALAGAEVRVGLQRGLRLPGLCWALHTNGWNAKG